MVRIAAALSLFLLAASAQADRTVEIVEYSIEAALTSLTMPSGASGNVIVNRECEGCEPRVLLATADTRYFLQNTQVPHAQFATQTNLLRQASDSDSAVVGVYYDPDSGRVTRVKLFTNED